MKKAIENKDEEEQRLLLESFLKTVKHFFGGWDAIFGKVFGARKIYLIKYSLTALLCTGVLLFIFRLEARRQTHHILGGNKSSEEKFQALLDIPRAPHGDTLNYAFKKIPVEAVQEVICWMVQRLIRLMEKGSLFRKNFPKGVGSQKNIAFRLLEA